MAFVPRKKKTLLCSYIRLLSNQLFGLGPQVYLVILSKSNEFHRLTIQCVKELFSLMCLKELPFSFLYSLHYQEEEIGKIGFAFYLKYLLMK